MECHWGKVLGKSITRKYAAHPKNYVNLLNHEIDTDVQIHLAIIRLSKSNLHLRKLSKYVGSNLLAFIIQQINIMIELMILYVSVNLDHYQSALPWAIIRFICYA